MTDYEKYLKMKFRPMIYYGTMELMEGPLFDCPDEADDYFASAMEKYTMDSSESDLDTDRETFMFFSYIKEVEPTIEGNN